MTVALENDPQTDELRKQMAEFDTPASREYMVKEINQQLVKEVSEATGYEEDRIILPQVQILNFFIAPEDKETRMFSSSPLFAFLFSFLASLIKVSK
jgi:hypothetical protein